MDPLRWLSSVWRNLFRKPRLDAELDEELRSYVELLTEEKVGQGMGERQARRAALVEVGGVEQVKERVREVRAGAVMETFLRDIRFGARSLRKNPGFTAVAVLTLALGIGANTAIFSVVNAVLLRPLPYQKSDELTALYYTNSRGEFEWPFDAASYLSLKSHNSVFDGVAAWSNKGWPANLTGGEEPERLQGYQVSADFFRVLGVSAERGRTFLAEEDRPGASRVVVISHGLWQRRFGGAPDVVGRSLTLNGAPYEVVGVMPADFRFIAKTDVWTPLGFTPAEENDHESRYLIPVARLKPGVTPEQARAEVENLSRSQTNDPSSDIRADLKPFQQVMTQDVRKMLLILFAAVAFVLLIACANVANLLLARGGGRRREFAIRAALGAGRLRLVRQLLVEGALLAAAGGACGLLLATWCAGLLVGGLPQSVVEANSHVAELKLDSTALLFTLGLSLLTTFIFGLAPALQTSKVNLNETLKDGARGDSQGGRQGRLRSGLVVAEIALAMVLLTCAGLMVKSFWLLNHTALGFETSRVLTARIDPSGDKYKEFDQVVGFYRELLGRVGAIPGVERVGIINSLDATVGVSVDEHPPVEPDKRPQASTNQVGGEYFRVMGIPLREGRFFDDRDVKGATPVVIIDETLARKQFPGEDPVGKHLRAGDVSREVVGVVGATKRYSLADDPFPRLYLPYQQENWWSMTLVVRSRSGDPATLAPAIRSELAAIDKDQPIHSFMPLEQSVAEWLTPQRFSTLLLTAFAALAATLAGVGIYGVMSYSVAQRTHEIGVRMALGARGRDVLVLVVRRGAFLTLAGAATGLAASVALTRLLGSLLYGVNATDPATYFVIALLLGAVALLACYVPARRATKVDPGVALRYE
jgi:putative ABC transport system permease protein